MEKYKYYCIYNELQNEVSKMSQKEDESLEYLVEIFSNNVKRSKFSDLGFDTLKTLLLKYVRHEWIDLINVVGIGYFSQLSFQDICGLFKSISRGKEKYGRSPQNPVMARVSKSTSRLVSQTKINTFLNILGNLNN